MESNVILELAYKWGTNPDWTYNDTFPAEYWSGASSSGTLVLLVNPDTVTVKKSAVWSEIPQLGGDAYQVTDVWSGSDLGCVKSQLDATISAHDTAAIVVGDAC